VGIEEFLEGMVGLCSEGTTVFFSSHQISEVERVADHVCMLHRGCLVLDASLDDLRQSYRRIDVLFPSIPPERDFWMAGVEYVRSRGHQMMLVASRNVDAVVERAHDFNASSIDVTPVGLREIFLEKVRAGLNDALV
jgi:ABC-2 type transport system ATP-binding protein